MMAFAVAAIFITWFAIRRGQEWALLAVAAAALVQVPYYVAISGMYAFQGAPLGRGNAGLLPL